MNVYVLVEMKIFLSHKQTQKSNTALGFNIVPLPPSHLPDTLFIGITMLILKFINTFTPIISFDLHKNFVG